MGARRIAVAVACCALASTGVAVALVIGGGDATSDPVAPTGPSFEVVHMNLCGALGCYGDHVPDRMEVARYAADVLESERVDVALLNEVCADQLDAVVERLRDSWPMGAVSVETLATDNGCARHPYGNAVLHRGQLLDEQTIGSCERSPEPCLENPPMALSAEQRAAVCATVRLPRITEPVTACSVHLVPRGRNALGDRTWDEWHDIQLRSLRDLVRSPLGDGTVVFGGDLNVGPDRVFAAWPQGWTELDQELRSTRPSPDPRRKIDFVMLSPDLRSVDARVLDVPRCPSSRLEDRWCTDHHPLAGTVTMGGRG
jgi:endonuclease/exonuclease/phosphatase family metal-dependent hydrolase